MQAENLLVYSNALTQENELEVGDLGKKENADIFSDILISK